MADRYLVSTPVDGIGITGGTDKTLLDITAPSDRRVRVYGVRISTKEIDADIPAAQFRLSITTVTGSGATSVTPIKVDPGAPADGLTATHSRTGYTEGAIKKNLGNIVVQGAAYVEVFPEPIIVAVSDRLALICDSTNNLTGVHAELLVEV